MDKATLFAMMDFGRARLLGSLDGIEKSGQDVAKVLAWRPGPGRAHIAWQAAHCAATHDRYLNVRLKGANPVDPAFCDAFGGGSTPSDTDVPSLALIREKLASTYAAYKGFLESADLSVMVDFPNNVKRSVGEAATLLAWHETHHQGQIHITWNLFKAAHGIK
jgi:hypothetical protein